MVLRKKSARGSNPFLSQIVLQYFFTYLVLSREEKNELIIPYAVLTFINVLMLKACVATVNLLSKSQFSLN